MRISKLAMRDIHSLAFDENIDLGIPLLKQKIAPGEAHLFISVGGCGADMIRETKGLINQNLCSDHDKHMAPERIAYLAFDTAANEKEKVSSKATGQVKLTDDELTILSIDELHILLDPVLIKYNMKRVPWIYRWLDTGIRSIGGRYYGRQVGRAALFLEMEKVIDKLRTTITNLITGTDVESLNIYVLSGVSGGTGSGMFLDMAYIVRQIADEVMGAGDFNYANMCIMGYLLMPDVNLLNADIYMRPAILLNAGAALQELDHAMRLPEIGDYYKCQYSNTMTITTSKPPFEYVHLISAKPKVAALPDDPYQHCLDTVAGSILPLVSSMRYFDGRWHPIPSVLYYTTVARLQNMARFYHTYNEKSNCYLSIGYSCWQVPNDKLIKYVFTVMFDKMAPIFKNEPTQDDVWNLFDSLSLSCDQIVKDLMGRVHKPLNPAQFTPKQLFGKQAIAIELFLPYDDCISEINRAFVNSIEDYENSIREQLQNAFVDRKRGPIWANHVVVQGANPTINALERLITEEKNRAMAERANAQSAADILLTVIYRMRNSYKANANQKKCQEYIEAWNEYFMAIIKVHCYDLLIGRTETLKYLGNQYSYGFYDEAQNTTAILNNQWLDVTRQVLEELKKIVQKNTDEFKKVAVNDTGYGFQWSTGNIPNLDKVIGDLIAKNGFNQTQMMTNFLNRLLSKADEWAQSVDVRKFIEEFLENEAQGVFNVSLEGLLASCFDDTAPLSDSVRKELMPYMLRSARPLFDGDQDMDYAGFITIPAGCAQIYNGVRGYVGQNANYNIETSYPRNRISVICTSVGISLHDYTMYEQCEKQLSNAPDARGLFLNQGVEDIAGRINHMEMPLPPVIPSRKRSEMYPAPERFAKYERSLVDEFREMRKGKYPFLRFEQTLDGTDYSLYLNLSVDLIKSGLYEKIREENYKNYEGKVDPDKLRKLIRDLKEMRYGQGLPEAAGLPKRLIICENLLQSATQEMKDRYHNLLPVEEEKVKIDVAWEVAEWYYVSAYSIYMRAKEEKAKYDEVQKKIEELEGILQQVQERPKS